MEIRIETKEFIPCLAQVASVVMSKNTLPILDCVLIDVNEDGETKLSASDSEVWLSAKTKVLSCDQAMKFCVPANDFLKALRGLGETEVSIVLDDKKKIIDCNYGKGYFTLPYESAEDYPQPTLSLEESKDFILDAANFGRAIERVDFAAATNDALRPMMNGVNLELASHGMTAAATDAAILARLCDFGVTHEEDATYSVTIHNKVVNLLKSLLAGIDGKVKIKFNNEAICVNNQSFKLTARLIEGKYPNYNAIIPKNYASKALVNKDAILSALKRVALMSDAKNGAISLHFTKGKVEISAEDLNFNRSAGEEVMCEYEGEDLTIGFGNSVLVSAIANSESEDVVMEFIDSTHMAILHDGNRDEYLSLVMPILIIE